MLFEPVVLDGNERAICPHHPLKGVRWSAIHRAVKGRRIRAGVGVSGRQPEKHAELGYIYPLANLVDQEPWKSSSLRMTRFPKSSSVFAQPNVLVFHYSLPVGSIANRSIIEPVDQPVTNSDWTPRSAAHSLHSTIPLTTNIHSRRAV